VARIAGVRVGGESRRGERGAAVASRQPQLGRVCRLGAAAAGRAVAMAAAAPGAKVLVVGASNLLAKAVTDRLIATGYSVSAVAQEGSQPGEGVEVVGRGDARDEEFVNAVVAKAKPDVILSMIKGLVEDCDRPDYSGNRNFIDAAVEEGVSRFMLISMIGVGDSRDSVPGQAADVLRVLLEDKDRAEMYLKESGLEHVIVRPGTLDEKAAAGEPFVTRDFEGYGSIGVDAAADLIVQALASPAASGQTLAALDRATMMICAPFVRPLEPFEACPVEPFAL